MKRQSVFLVNDTSVSGHPGCVTVMSVIRDNFEMRGLSIAGRWPMGAEPHLGLSITPALRQADAVVVNGEGTIHNTHTRPGARRLLHSIKRALAATSAPLFLVNATIENLRPRDFEVLKLCERIFLRDRASCRYAEENGLDVVFTPDLCFSSSYRQQLKTNQHVVTDSTIPITSASLHRWSRTVNARFLPMQLSRIRSMFRWAVTPRLHEKAADLYFSLISNASSVVTGRFHGSVFAMIGETPFLALGSNTSKIQSLLDDVLGERSRFIGADQLDTPGLSVPAFSLEELSLVRAYRISAAALAQGMFDHIAQSAVLYSRKAVL